MKICLKMALVAEQIFHYVRTVTEKKLLCLAESISMAPKLDIFRIITVFIFGNLIFLICLTDICLR